MSVSLLMVSYRRPSLLAKTLKTIGHVDEIAIIEDIRPHQPGEFLNPAPLWNHALSITSGDILIIQNPECIHMNNVIGTLSMVPKGEAWFASCESVNSDESFHMWYTHPEYRRRPYFFCGSINRSDMVKWDEDFIHEGYEDVALGECLKANGVNFNWIPPEDAYVKHQWHSKDISSSDTSVFFRKYGYLPPND